MASEARRDEPQAEAAAKRTASTWFIGAFLAFQLLMPLRYYLGSTGDDERFSWRMFSSVRMKRCTIAVREQRDGVNPEPSATREVKLEEAVQIAWIGMLERNRPQVVEKLLATRCHGTPRVSEVRYERSCQATDGSTLPLQIVRKDCGSGKITREGSTP